MIMVPDGLGERAAALWVSLGQSSTSTPLGALALEACRAADRLDGLSAVIEGKGVLRLMHFRLRSEDDDLRVVELHVDQALAEARQQQSVFARLLSELGSAKEPTVVKAVGPADQLASRREGRGSASAHSPRPGVR